MQNPVDVNDLLDHPVTVRKSPKFWQSPLCESVDVPYRPQAARKLDFEAIVELPKGPSNG